MGLAGRGPALGAILEAVDVVKASGFLCSGLALAFPPLAKPCRHSHTDGA